MFLHLVEHNLTCLASMRGNFITVNPTYNLRLLQKENGPGLLSLLVYMEDSSGVAEFTYLLLTGEQKGEKWNFKVRDMGL